MDDRRTVHPPAFDYRLQLHDRFYTNSDLGELIMKLKLVLLATLAVASVNAMACYTVYDQSNRMVYNAQTSPVDMSRPLHETLPALFPGSHMVFGATTDCPREPSVRTVSVAAPVTAKRSPLLTDRRTAEAMNVPHTILPSGVALVNNPPPMDVRVTVLASTPAPAAAIPVAYATPAVAQRTQQHRDTVITEMHNPPLTLIQQGGMVISELR
jgi:hypothetical protein